MRNIIVAALILTLAPLAAMAQSAGSLSGKWKTIDDETNAPRSIVEITEVNGELQGRILQIFYRPDEKPDPVCEACEGDRKDKPVIGMTFLWGLKPDGANEWASGSVLDPKNGKIYNAKATLTEAGQKLRLRGFIGTPILGRTQIWLREP
ncbi:MAG: DUF2147 domain-containing protein [Ferrovibrio sp.]